MGCCGWYDPASPPSFGPAPADSWTDDGDAMVDALESLVAVGEGTSAFLYAGLPGEPALGPATYMHRFSGMANPEAPIGHHWLDSTHVTFGVATAGVVVRGVKLEGSLFTGREPERSAGWAGDALSRP